MDLEGAGPDAPITTNEHGGSQSHIPYRFDLIDGPALAEMAKVLHMGAEKYGPNNWRKIPEVEVHLNHMIMHAYAYLAGDRTDDHLSHIMCRAMFAQAVDITNAESAGEAKFTREEVAEILDSVKDEEYVPDPANNPYDRM